MVRLTGFICAVALAAATPALAAPAAKPPPTPRIFISPSGEPFRAGPNVPDPMKAWFDQVDAAHKGYIDRADFRADAARFFKTLDENGDGIIDGFEVADYEAKVVPELAEAAEGRMPGQFGPGRDQGGGGQGAEAPVAEVEAAAIVTAARAARASRVKTPRKARTRRPRIRRARAVATAPHSTRSSS